MASGCDVGFGRHPAGITQLLPGCMEVMDVLCFMEVLWKLYSLYSKKVTSLTILGCVKFIPAFMPALPRKRSLEDGNQPAPKWRIRLGDRAKGIRNPIREIMDTIAGKAPVTFNVEDNHSIQWRLESGWEGLPIRRKLCTNCSVTAHMFLHGHVPSALQIGRKTHQRRWCLWRKGIRHATHTSGPVLRWSLLSPMQWLSWPLFLYLLVPIPGISPGAASYQVIRFPAKFGFPMVFPRPWHTVASHGVRWTRDRTTATSRVKATLDAAQRWQLSSTHQEDPPCRPRWGGKLLPLIRS